MSAFQIGAVVESSKSTDKVPLSEKVNWVKKTLMRNIDHPNQNEKNQLIEFLYGYRVLFDKEVGKVPYHARISTRCDPVSKNQYPIPPHTSLY